MVTKNNSINDKEIGGYMELELDPGSEYYYGEDVAGLNTGRAAIYYALKCSGVEKVYLPYYLCTSMLQPVESLKMDYEFYPIDENFHPVGIEKTNENEAFLYINYFGTGNTEFIKSLRECHPNLLIDNTQAFFEKPLEGTYNLYSARKFFGVNDGAYLIKKGIDKEAIKKATEKQVSYTHASHLLKRIEMGAHAAYNDNMDNENRFDIFRPMMISALSKRILKSINYQRVILKRQANFYRLHSVLKEINELKLDGSYAAPMVYPLLVSKKGLREHLVTNKIYVPSWWKDVLFRAPKDSFEAHLSNYIIPLPIDQRYDSQDMKIIEDVVFDFLQNKKVQDE